MIAQKEYSQKVQARIRAERMAVDIIACVHELFYDRSVEIVMFRNTLIDCKASGILELHQYAKEVVGKTINVDDSLEMLSTKKTAIENANWTLDD